MADFTKHSNFNPECGFTSVVFGANAPVLEVELNELQQILNRKLGLFFKYWGDAVLPLGEELYTYSDDTITLKNCAVICDGEIIYIKESSIPIDSNIDFGYISVRVEKETVVTCSDTLTCCGDKNGYVVDNTIMDNRNPIETTRRTVIPYEVVFSEVELENTDVYTYVPVITLTRNEETGELEEQVVATDTVTVLKEQLVTKLEEVKSEVESVKEEVTQTVEEVKTEVQQTVEEVKTEVKTEVETVKTEVEEVKTEIEENVTQKIEEVETKVETEIKAELAIVSDTATKALETATNFSYIRHDETGELYRIGLDSNGIYVVKYKPDDDSEEGGDTSDPNEPVVMMLNFTDEEKDIKAEIDNVDHNIENATTNEAEVTDSNYLFTIN